MSKTIEHFARLRKHSQQIKSRVMEIRALAEDKTDRLQLRTERDTLDKKYAEGEVKFQGFAQGDEGRAGSRYYGDGLGSTGASEG